MNRKYRYRLAIATFSAVIFIFFLELTRNNPPQKSRELQQRRLLPPPK